MKPILFNTEMVKAILEGRKTVTRRVIKEIPSGVDDSYHSSAKPKYQVGDVLWVRETFNCIRFGNGKTVPFETEHWYKADDTSQNPDNKWCPSIFMPKTAARIFLEVTGVRVERLQDMKVEDVIKEGSFNDNDYNYYGSTRVQLAFDLWEYTWNSTIKKNDLDQYDWNANPWVWVIEFERTEGHAE